MNTIIFISPGKWNLGIGDPTPAGWVIFTAYIIVSLLCFSVGFSIRKQPESKDKKKICLMWYGLSLLLLLLGINKQLDLQVLLTTVARTMAQEQGWINKRREVQKLFIIGFSTFSVISLTIIYWWLKKQLNKHKFILIGVIFLLSFVLIRAASFHHVELIPNFLYATGSYQMKLLAEMAGILLIGTSAVRELYRIKNSVT